MGLTSKWNESYLTSELKLKNPRALEYLYDSYSPALYGIIFKIVNEENDANDILQESFLKIWTHIESYNPEVSTIFTWMMNICRHQAIDKLKSKSHTNSKKTINDYTNLNSQTSPYQIGIDMIGMNEFIEKLNPEHKQLIDLLYFKGYTQVEASNELQMPLGSVKTKLRSAINQLRNLMS